MSENGIAPHPGKVAAIKQWPTPTCAHDVQVYLGLTNYYV